MTHARSSLSRQRLYDACEDGRRGGAVIPSSRTGRGSASARSYRFQHSLIVVETALAVLLLTMGGLLLQTFHQLRGVDLGIRRENVLTFVTPRRSRASRWRSPISRRSIVSRANRTTTPACRSRCRGW
jgi:hypothetical protein